MPAPVGELHFLALLTREREGRINAPEPDLKRLYDLRAFKTPWAELGYLRRLGGSTGGTKVTSTVQLVKGLARLHPAWRMDGDAFADRDRHHKEVQSRLDALTRMGLLRYRTGQDINGDDARLEIELLPPPPVTDHELAPAAAQLARWQAKYGEDLNTGSSTGVRDAARHARPLTPSEQQKRGIARARAAAQARRQRHPENKTPHHSVAPNKGCR